MFDSRILDLFRAFSSQELQNFPNSVFYSAATADEKNFFHYINEHFLLESAEILLEKNFVHNKIYENKSFSENRINKLMSNLHSVLENYIIHNANNSEMQRNLSLARFYRERGINNRFESLVNQLTKAQESIDIKDREYYLNDFLIKNETTTIFFDAQKDKALQVVELIESLDKFYTLLKLEYTSILLHENNVINLSVNQDIQPLISKVLEHINDNEFENSPLILLYIQAIKIILGTNIDYNDFLEFYKNLETHKKLLPEKPRSYFYGYARSFCSIKYNEGNDEYLYILHEILEHQLENGEFYQDGKIMANVLLNLLNTSFRLKLYDNAHKLIEQHKTLVLSENSSEEIYTFNLANYYFHIGQFGKAQALNFHFISFENIYYDLATKRLEIKIFFEMDEPDLLIAKIEAFKVWLFRKKSYLPVLAFDVNNDFIDMLRQIISPNTYKNADRIEKLTQKIKDNRAFAEREWLLEKLEKLGKNNNISQ